MQTQAAQSTLASALDATGHQLVALAGAGGKSTALQVLAQELSASGSVVATTTTMMLERQLTTVGPLLLEEGDDRPLAERTAGALREAPVVALAHSLTQGDKVNGLAPAAVDALWDGRLADAIVVEADGGRGLSLKAFGVDEPQLPARTTVAVVLAGLDVIGVPLDGDHVHRADVFASLLGATPGAAVTPELVGRALALQVARVRTLAPHARVVVLLNKADDRERAEQAVVIADALTTSTAVDHDAARPDRVVAGSLTQRTYAVVLR